MSKGNHLINGFAGRMVDVRQSAIDNGRVVLEIQNAQGDHCASVVLMPYAAKALSDALEHHAKTAIALTLRAEMAVSL